ncbi:zinc ABC transporter substrate-binding lipoprotein AdcA [Staphylococcus pettenkoferi]|uniref:zinc ABC transporter substrate-binding lipoprotein AdcA n=1 Tax=Staphylococcus pettenkoferi TaxID=170573 RepID=UPI001C8B497F|nr:zinc ABC transporter substrate-binding lipoprotein AdcA [Staphylococcus pettenkoferi]MBX8994545.1 zinc ABC transporter substrate-binding lipoprotein AdcA [Staphylococcus pettenkoferi]
MKKILLLVLSAIVAITLSACGEKLEEKKDTKGNSKDKKIEVNTTVFPLKSFTEQIGGKHVKVKSVYPPGTDLHDYEPTQKDIINASKSDLFVYTGDDLDPVAKKIAGTIKDEDKKLSLENGIDKSKLLTDQHEHGEGDHHHEGHEHHHHGGYDPHIWLDPKYNEEFTKEIKNDLVKKDPDNKDYYEKNYKKLQKDLKQTDEKMKDVTKDKKGNAVFISHESLGYLADRYGFVQKGVQSMNAEDPSQSKLTKLTKEIQDNDVKYILYENNIPHKMVDNIRKETNAKPLKFNNMESLSKEDLKSDKSYQDYMDQNIKSIDKALNANNKVKDEKSAHKHDKAIQDGYFKENQVKDRPLSDYKGEWQSVYPLLENNKLDKVMKHKAEEDKSMTEKEYKDYYKEAYKTNIKEINISNNNISFIDDKGNKFSGDYKYDGYKVLDKEEGKKGVKYIFKLENGDKKSPKYVQFSDHNIKPTKAAHFHIYMGDDKEKLLKEDKHFPTFYPKDMTSKEVQEEMLAH